MKISIRLFSILFVLCQLMMASSVYAQATRTWVSGVGDDVNPCSRTAPCKTFAGAISKTASPGEIDALDPGGFGTVTVTKSIIIDGQGTQASILASGVQGVIINAQVGDTVILRNLQINGAGTTLGTNGINFLSGKALHIENCKISNFSGAGILIDPTAAATGAKITISNSEFTNNPGGAIRVAPQAGSTANVTINNTTMQQNVLGLRADASGGSTVATVVVQNSVASNNTNSGFVAVGAGVAMSIDGSVASANGTIGVDAQLGAMVRVSNTLVTRNTTAGLNNTSGTIETYGNNRLRGNLANDAVSVTTVSQQ